MKIVDTKVKGWSTELSVIMKRGEAGKKQAEKTIKKILLDVKKHKDAALVKYTLKFDSVDISGSIEVKEGEIKKAFAKIPKKDIELLMLAKRRIEAFHKRQVTGSWAILDAYGNELGQKVTPLKRVGIYVPGGKASYPSTVLMNAIPAKVAGVREIIMATPPSKDGINPYVLTAAKIAGVDKIFRIGGAQAIAGLAFGTESIPKVDKITGPGNIYVATAKKLVYGEVAIDMVAGPSEILIINDGSGIPAYIAADLLSQAEHDELASAILVTTSEGMAKDVNNELSRQIKNLKRKIIAKTSINRYGRIFMVKNLDEAADISNEIAPEHLELYVKEPLRLLKKIKNAGAIFLGPFSPEAVGDYLAGPNHTLPTGGTARFSSPLSAYDFVKISNVIGFSKKGFKRLAKSIERFAELEGLDAHAKSVRIRLKTNF